MKDPNIELDVEVFRAGDFGPKGRYGESDLDAIADGYDPSRHEAPVTLDHAQDGPAHGWVKRLRRLGNRLVATLWKLSPGFVERLREGAYRKCSVELYRDFGSERLPYLKAVSFLGAASPEIKDLGAPFFSESAPMPQPPPPPLPAQLPLHAESQPLEEKPAAIEPEQSELSDLSDAPAAPALPESPDSTAVSALRERLAALKRSGRLLPAWEKAGLAAFAESLLPHGGGAAAEWFLTFLESLPEQIHFASIAEADWAGREADGSAAHPARADNLEPNSEFGIPRPSPRAEICPHSTGLHRRAIQFMNERPGATYAEALGAAAREESRADIIQF